MTGTARGALMVAALVGWLGGPAPGGVGTGAAQGAAQGSGSDVAATGAPDTVPLERRLFPGRSYDPEIQSPTQFFGYPVGGGLATYSELIPYLEYLASSSDRVTLASHGESYEGRRIYHAVVTSPAHLARLDTVRARLAALADPRALVGPEAEDSLLRELPVAVMLNYGTDGAETAGPEAAIQILYQYAAATDAATARLLDSAVVVVIPAMNPDSHGRTVAWYRSFRVGPRGTADPNAAEHDFPWGINSMNHYQVDLNRESVWGTQRETRAMVRLYQSWRPQVFVDNHGEYDTYTGPRYAEPLHEQLTAGQRATLASFEAAIRGRFEEHGYAYAAWEYGQFDPGYWDTYPNFTGAVAFTTETTGGGSRGLRLRSDTRVFTLADGIVQHVLAGDATVRHAAERREELLRSYLEYRRTAIASGRRGPERAYALSSTSDARRLVTVVNTLRRNGIEVYRTTRDAALEGRPYFVSGGDGSRPRRSIELPAGSYVVPLAQPESRLARVMLEPEARFSPEFLARVEAAGVGQSTDLFYDITGWSMPLTYGLVAYELAGAVPDTMLTAADERVGPAGSQVGPAGGAGYLVRPEAGGSLRALVGCRTERLHCLVATEGFELAGRSFPAGTVALMAEENPGRDLAPVVRALVEERGVRIAGVGEAEGLEDTGLGPDAFVNARTGRIAVAMGDPVSATGYGHVWFTLERRWGVEFTALRFPSLADVDLQEYDVVILPDGRYGAVPGTVAGVVADRLGAWVRAGGLLIAMRGAAAWLADADRGVTRARVRPGPDGTGTAPVVPGAILRAAVSDRGHPLLFGYRESEIPVMVWSGWAFEPGAAVEAPVRVAEASRALVSGFASSRSLDHLGGSPYVIRDRPGKGSVILFLDDPIFRLFWDGLEPMFLNAVFLGRVD